MLVGEERRVFAAKEELDEWADRTRAAETQLLCRADRELTAGDLDRLIEAKRAEIAADREVITRAQKLRMQLRAGRLGIHAVRGGAR